MVSALLLFFGSNPLLRSKSRVLIPAGQAATKKRCDRQSSEVLRQAFFWIFWADVFSCCGFGFGAVRTVVLCERFEVFGLVIDLAVLPTGVEDADPFVGQGTHSGVVGFAAFDFGLDELLGPGASEGGVLGKLDPGLVLKLRLGPPPADDTGVAA